MYLVTFKTQSWPIYRFIYVRTSLQDEIQRVFKRNAFTFSFLVMGVFYSFFNIFVYIYDQKETGINRLRLVLYHACMDPLSQFRVPLITVMPTSQITLYIMNIVNIACNFYLYMFLEVQRKANSGEGLQNLLSLIHLLSCHCFWREEGEEEEPAASLGGHLRHHCVPVPHYLLAGRLLSQRGTFHYFTQTLRQSFIQNGMDSSVRALIVAFSTDFYYCLYCPALVLYACPSVRRNCRLLTGFSVTPSSKSRNVFRQDIFWFYNNAV